MMSPYLLAMGSSGINCNSGYKSKLPTSIPQTSAICFDLPKSHNQEPCVPRAIRGCFSSTSINNPLVEQTSQTIGSDTNVSCNDLSEMMNPSNISQPGGISSFPTQLELDNLRALCELAQYPLYAQSQVSGLEWSTPYSSDGFNKTIGFHRNDIQPLDAAFCTWSGILPPRFLSANPTFSCKLFLGGVPWDTTEETLIRAFSQFGTVRVEWPGKEQAANQPKGYVYIILESENHVRALLNCCTCTVSSGNCKNWFFRIQSRKMKSKEVQVIPWTLEESNFAQSPSQRVNPHNTVFVGALHGMINAEGLFKIMNDLFGGVVYTGIDTDKFKYPIGSARVTFSNRISLLNAVTAGFVQVKTPKFTKKLQVDPYLDESVCSYCESRQGNYFCRELVCFRYFCFDCWFLHHPSNVHKPLVRRSKTNTPSTMIY